MNIAIIGGSITEGAGASDYSKSYVFRLEKYLKEKYENLNLINLGAGGKASNFALFRLHRDLKQFKPDVIMLEFAVNDRIYNTNDSSLYFEGLIRECSKYTKKILIIDFPTGMCDAATNIHKKSSYFYNIPLIDVQDAVWRKIGNREFKWSKISVDNLHPNDIGHELYFEIIKSELEKLDLDDIEMKMDYRILGKYKFKNPSLVEYDSKKIEYYGNWAEGNANLNNKFDKCAMTASVGDGVVLDFEGRCLSMMNTFSRDSGILECQLDNYVFKIDLFMDTESRFDTTININNLQAGSHTLILKVSGEKNLNSSGNRVVIGGFLVDE
ncbi:SGNH/GDSL hydrolase family protein [Clostridium butyricum]|uniref:SGNH/GDSL hydrolase family protein n=1 Tax=Clostridium butyricum TaxID=1492 RepID=UPI00374E774E